MKDVAGKKIVGKIGTKDYPHAINSLSTSQAKSLHEELGRVKSLCNLSTTIANSLDSFVLLDTIRGACKETVPSDFAAIALTDERSGEFVWASQDLTARNRDIESAAFGLCRTVLGSGKALVQNRSKELGFSFIGTPMLVKKSVKGVICLVRGTKGFSPKEQGWLGDISVLAGIALEKVKTHEKMELQAAELSSIFEAMAYAVVGVSYDGKIALLNKAAETLLGTRAASGVNRDIKTIFPERLVGVVDSFVKGLRDGNDGIVNCEVKMASGDGSTLLFDAQISAWRSSNAILPGAIVLLRDITEEKVSQQRLQQMDRLMSIGQIVAGVAHELNNPLATICGYSQMLVENNEDKSLRKKLTAIAEEAGRCAGIVRNLLTFAREHKPERSATDVNEVIQSVENFRSYALKVNKIDFSVDLDDSVPRTMVDPNQLRQVLINLVNNAEYAMLEAHKGGKLSISSALLEGGTRIRIEVTDTGPGIPEHVMGRLFTPFFTTKPAGKGTGLGLSICFGIIREHGGNVWAESKPEGGATFIIELPVVRNLDKKEETTKRVDSAQAATDLRGKRALVVDDEKTIRELLTDYLTKENMIVECAGDGEAAVEKLERSTYDVIISDMKMPKLDGREMIDRIRQKDPHAAGNVIFMTGTIVSSKAKDLVKDVGADYIQKPFSLNDMLDKIRRNISKKKDA